MQKTKFKEIFRRVRKIRSARYVGTHGHLSDIVDEFNVSIQFLRKVREMNNKREKLVYGKYTKEYIDNQNQAVAWEVYGERKWMC